MMILSWTMIWREKSKSTETTKGQIPVQGGSMICTLRRALRRPCSSTPLIPTSRVDDDAMMIGRILKWV